LPFIRQSPILHACRLSIENRKSSIENGLPFAFQSEIFSGSGLSIENRKSSIENISMISPPCHLCRSADLRRHARTTHGDLLRCGRCGLIVREGIESSRATGDYATDAYQRGQAGTRVELRETIFRQALDAIEQRHQPPGRLLDVGCGDGLFLKLAAQHRWEGSGVELSPAACELARQNLGGGIRQQAAGTIHCGDLAGARFQENFFDVVTLFNVLDHLPDPLGELRAIRRLLKPGGLLMIRVPNGAFHVTLLRRWPALERQLIVHLYALTPRTLTALLAAADLHAVDIRNAPLTPADPYGVSPLFGDWGMAWIKRVIFTVAQSTAALTGGRWLVGPSLLAWAAKPLTMRD
jgi:2-polyprenyl-3-methyl-5-hydroxy-6-metoxy-1,4-benzoquinol methylase